MLLKTLDSCRSALSVHQHFREIHKRPQRLVPFLRDCLQKLFLCLFVIHLYMPRAQTCCLTVHSGRHCRRVVHIADDLRRLLCKLSQFLVVGIVTEKSLHIIVRLTVLDLIVELFHPFPNQFNADLRLLAPGKISFLLEDALVRHILSQIPAALVPLTLAESAHISVIDRLFVVILRLFPAPLFVIALRNAEVGLAELGLTVVQILQDIQASHDICPVL